MHKNYRYSYFYNKKSNCVLRFSVKPPNIPENRVKMSISDCFRIKVMRKWLARKPIGWNSSPITLTEKWKISLDVFSFQCSCIHFLCMFIEKISYKSTWENFASVSGRLRTGLKQHRLTQKHYALLITHGMFLMFIEK